MSVPDGQIASIALANHLAIATRNIRDFEECGMELINSFLTQKPGQKPGHPKARTPTNCGFSFYRASYK